MSASIQSPKFVNKDEEIKYWKNLAHEYIEELERMQKESDEFMTESKQLEREYETTIDQNERKIKELTISHNRAQNEIDALRVKLEICYKETTNQQTEIEGLKSEKQQLVKKIIELEKCNDDLERSRRIIEESMAGFEQALNSALEKNAILENEVDEKEYLKEKLQRVADEARGMEELLLSWGFNEATIEKFLDLKQELLVKEKERAPNNERFLNGFKNAAIDNRLKENETQTSPSKLSLGSIDWASSQSIPWGQDEEAIFLDKKGNKIGGAKPKESGDYQTPSLSPASRVMALNIVSDLIRKVGGLERRLDYRELQSTELRKGRHSSLNGSSPSMNGV